MKPRRLVVMLPEKLQSLKDAIAEGDSAYLYELEFSDLAEIADGWEQSHLSGLGNLVGEEH